MGIGVSLFLFAMGAVLKWAVTVDTSGINLDTVGVILMVVGAIGFLVSLLFWSSVAPFGRRDGSSTTVIRDREREVV